MRATLVAFAPAKINLFLEVQGRRPDGFHELITVMETIAVGDRIEVAEAPELRVTADRDDVPSGPENLVWRMVTAAEKRLGRSLPARISIEKEVAPGTGLGAGSSDAAAALGLVLALHHVAVDLATRLQICADVGSDVGFFLAGGLAVCTGRGDLVQTLPQLGARHVVLVLAGSPCSTPAVYGALVRGVETSQSFAVDARRRPDVLLEALAAGRNLAGGHADAQPFNRLAGAAEVAYPEVAHRRLRLTAIAGRAPVLSGSGSAFYFLCQSAAGARHLATLVRAAEPAWDVRATASWRPPGGGAAARGESPSGVPA